jgi:hypothetical protein
VVGIDGDDDGVEVSIEEVVPDSEMGVRDEDGRLILEDFGPEVFGDGRDVGIQ